MKRRDFEGAGFSQGSGAPASTSKRKMAFYNRGLIYYNRRDDDLAIKSSGEQIESERRCG
jgi:hypothetical protein